MMLDLSCTFNSVVHELLMTRLEQSFGITNKALAWLRSYISERYQKMVVASRVVQFWRVASHKGQY